jgi:hypothetical protein
MANCKQQGNDLSKAIEQKIKNQFEVIKRIDVYIGTTNTKCTIIMSYCAAVVALILTLIGKVQSVDTNPAVVCIGLFGCFSLIAAIICMLMACFTIFPITFSSPNRNRGESLIFYGDIVNAEGGSDGYAKRIIEFSDEEYLNYLSGQVFTLSKIVDRKFWLIQKLSAVLCIHFACVSAFLVAVIINAFS